MSNERLVKISKYLSRHLRHEPERLGLALAPGGWVDVETLLAACAQHRFPITRPELETVVAQSDKKRFSFSQDGTRIRANQGHSVEVDLQLLPATPPPVLYHGTGSRVVEIILREGLKKMGRHHVHLSSDIDTATKVGARHGRPVVLRVDTAAMARDGHTFFCSDNGVWLVDEVPAKYLQQAEHQ